MGKGACFIKAVLHMVNRSKQRKVMCSHFRLISSNEVQTVFRLSPSLFSQPCRFRRAVKSASFPPGEAKGAVTYSPGISLKRGCLPQPLSRCGGSSALHETAVRRRGRLHPLNQGALGDGIVPCDHERGRSTIYHKNFRSILAFFAVFPLYNRWGL